MGEGALPMELGVRSRWIGPRMRWALAVGALCTGPSWTQGVGPEGEPVQVESSAFEAPGSDYHDGPAINALLDRWVEQGGGNVRRVEGLGAAPAIEFGAGDLKRRPLAKRRTVLLIGGLDGRGVAGGESVLHAGHKLLADLEDLRPDLAFLLVPWASPEGLSLVDRGQVASGRDLDGDGLVLEMLVEDPAGPWTPSRDPRFLCAAEPGDAPRYVRVPEGGDVAGGNRPHDLEVGFPLLSLDGRAEVLGFEDGPGGDVVRGLMDFVLGRPCALVISFQGNHGGLAFPGAAAATPWAELPDGALYRNLGRAFRSSTGRAGAPVQSILEARGGVERGSFVDWCYAVPGVVAFEIAPWGMGLSGADDQDNASMASRDAWDFRREPDGRGGLWAHWLDEVRGGTGFSEWRPVVTAGGNSCLVGGWKPRNFWNPPQEELAGALKGLPEFVHDLVQRLPYLELCDVLVEREGELCTVTARLRCVGSIPMQPQVFGRWAGMGDGGSAWLAADLPKTVERIAGPGKQVFPRLESGGRSLQVRWLLFAPEGTRMAVSFGLGATELGHLELVL